MKLVKSIYFENDEPKTEYQFYSDEHRTFQFQKVVSLEEAIKDAQKRPDDIRFTVGWFDTGVSDIIKAQELNIAYTNQKLDLPIYMATAVVRLFGPFENTSLTKKFANAANGYPVEFIEGEDYGLINPFNEDEGYIHHFATLDSVNRDIQEIKEAVDRKFQIYPVL